MLLNEINISQKSIFEEPLLKTKDSPRKAYFKGINRGVSKRKSIKRFRDSGVTVRGNMWGYNPQSQRVVVKISVVKNKSRKIKSALNGGSISYGGTGANLSSHISYISRPGAGESEEKAVLFDKENDGINGKEFFERSRNDRHHFRMIISPENGDKIENFESYVRDVMNRAEKDLGCNLDWISAVHHDTDDVHAHVVIRGVRTLKQFRKTEKEVDLVIDRQYISFGFRNRAQERVSEILGERSIEEVKKSMEEEVDALRVTSLDRFIESRVDSERKVDVRSKQNFGKDKDFERLIKNRLNYLEELGFANQNPPGVFQLQEDYIQSLYSIKNHNDVVKGIRSKFGNAIADNIKVYSMEVGQGEGITGFVVGKGFADEVTDKKYVVIEDTNKKMHYVPVGEINSYDTIENGSLISIKSGGRSSGKADYNIKQVAKENNNIYSIDKHIDLYKDMLAGMDEDVKEGYLNEHLKRIDTLEKNGVVSKISENEYQISKDFIKECEELNLEMNKKQKKRFYPNVSILSKDKLEDMVSAEKKTLIDIEIYKRNIKASSALLTGERIEKAVKLRQGWLVDKGYGFIKSNGEFGLKDYVLPKLDNLELKNTTQKLSEKFKVKFDASYVQEGKQYRYLGYVELENGYWAVVGTLENTMQMAKLEKKPMFNNKNACVEFNSLEDKKFAIREVELQKLRDIEQDDNELER